MKIKGGRILGFPIPFQREIIPTHVKHKSEILNHVTRFFKLSKLCTGIPCLIMMESIPVSPRWYSGSSIWSYLLLINAGILFGFSLIQNGDWIRDGIASQIIIRIYVLLVIIWNQITSSKIIQTIRQSPSIENRLKIYTQVGQTKRLRYICLILGPLYILGGIMLTLLGLVKSYLIDESWINYSKHACGFYSTLLLHPTITNVYCLLSNFTTNLTWLWPDWTLFFLSIIFGSFYARLVRVIRSIDSTKFSVSEIDLIRQHFGILSSLLHDYDSNLAFLNLISVVSNIGILLINVYALVISNQSKVIDLWLTIGMVGVKSLIPLFAATYVQRKAREASIYIRSWPLTRDPIELLSNHARISIMNLFLTEMSTSGGFSFGKLIGIGPVSITGILLGLLSFIIFTRISITGINYKKSGHRS